MGMISWRFPKQEVQSSWRKEKTTFEERAEIASYCISHAHNYAKTDEKFGVSYQQAWNDTVKYEKNKIDALQNNRGKWKPQHSLTELEKLREELKLEKAEMETSFLKMQWNREEAG